MCRSFSHYATVAKFLCREWGKIKRNPRVVCNILSPHDAQMLARIAPAAMIFVPSVGGISHNPKEFTPDADLIAGANVLLDVVRTLSIR